ncbi:MAG: hypothetical protein P8046_15205, partial [Anaerolineales bacterium]
MKTSEKLPDYPRNQLIRGSFQTLGKFLLALLTKRTVSGYENYPQKGRLIVVANHTGIKETVMLTSTAPRQIEFTGS